MGEKKRRLAAGATGKGAVSTALAHGARAKVFMAQSAFGPALEQMVVALELAPEVESLWAQFSDLIRFYNFRHPLDERLRALLTRALDHAAVDPGDLVRPICSTALSRPGGDVLNDALLLRLLEDTVIRDPVLEDLLVAERRKALDERAAPLERLIAIAHQCFNTEYVFAQSASETAAAEALSPNDPYGYAAYAAYKPLGTLPDAVRVAERLAATPLAALARRQILEPMEEERLRTQIACAGAMSGAVSAAVRAQYEANPYPRWIRLPMRRESAAKKPGPTRVLIAGCGTGQHAIATARHMPEASVLAIDLSLASLAYAQRKTRELGVANIEYRQADLLALGSWTERFDVVEASGVLHHLQDPLAGWRVLADRVLPGGSMRIGLYSERGRRHIVRARELIAEQGFDASTDGIRRCRAAIRARRDDALLAKIVRNEDFYSMSGCRDLLFHVQEHRFELPQIKRMLEELGLRFAGFEFADSGMALARYRARFAGDPAMTDLDNWHRLEEEHPDTFARMYQFWVEKPA